MMNGCIKVIILIGATALGTFYTYQIHLHKYTAWVDKREGESGGGGIGS